MVDRSLSSRQIEGGFFSFYLSVGKATGELTPKRRRDILAERTRALCADRRGPASAEARRDRSADNSSDTRADCMGDLPFRVRMELGVWPWAPAPEHALDGKPQALLRMSEHADMTRQIGRMGRFGLGASRDPVSARRVGGGARTRGAALGRMTEDLTGDHSQERSWDRTADNRGDRRGKRRGDRSADLTGKESADSTGEERGDLRGDQSSERTCGRAFSLGALQTCSETVAVSVVSSISPEGRRGQEVRAQVLRSVEDGCESAVRRRGGGGWCPWLRPDCTARGGGVPGA